MNILYKDEDALNAWKNKVFFKSKYSTNQKKFDVDVPWILAD